MVHQQFLYFELVWELFDLYSLRNLLEHFEIHLYQLIYHYMQFLYCMNKKQITLVVEDFCLIQDSF